MGGSTKVRKDDNIIKAESEVANEYRKDFNSFVRNVMPLVNEQISSLNDNSMVTRAIEDNKQTAQMSGDIARRNKARVGLGTASSAQRISFNRQRKRQLAANMAGNENNSRLVQKDRNENVALGLASMGNNYRQQGLDDMMNAIGIGSNRAQANAASASQAKQQNLGTAASLATMAIMAF